MISNEELDVARLAIMFGSAMQSERTYRQYEKDLRKANEMLEEARKVCLIEWSGVLLKLGSLSDDSLWLFLRVIGDEMIEKGCWPDKVTAVLAGLLEQRGAPPGDCMKVVEFLDNAHRVLLHDNEVEKGRS